MEDGIEAIRGQLPLIIEMIAKTAKWVHPDTFRALPVWHPETARGQPDYNAEWTAVYINKRRNLDKKEANIKAAKALQAALEAEGIMNWTCCHIWGVDDPSFRKRNVIVGDHRFYSCVGNMILLPTPLKGFTDSVPEIKRILRTCAYHLYGWACDHEEAKEEAEEIIRGEIPPGYPDEWPRSRGEKLPPGTAEFSDAVQNKIEKRKEKLRLLLESNEHPHFPREEVKDVLAYWEKFMGRKIL